MTFEDKKIWWKISMYCFLGVPEVADNVNGNQGFSQPCSEQLELVCCIPLVVKVICMILWNVLLSWWQPVCINCETERTFHPGFNVVATRSESLSLRRMWNRGGLSLILQSLWHSLIEKVRLNNVASIIIDLKHR